MADITMCEGKNCPKKDTCYRYKAKPSKLQSWSKFEDICHDANEYAWYWSCEDEYEYQKSKE